MSNPVSPSVRAVLEPLNQWLFGLEEPLTQCLAAMLCGGHVLLEGPPGTAKTLMVKLLAQSFHVPFKRVQFTSDLMPADIIGTNIFNPQENAFRFSPGPLFTTFLLADEINRSPAKTQSALLESMQERQVTVDGVGYPLSSAFTVFATQNPLEHEGTYPLPEAQLDRFLFKLVLPYPTRSMEVEILKRHHGEATGGQEIALPPALSEADLLTLRQQANAVEVQESILAYVAELAEQSRRHPSIAIGASPRAAILWVKAAKALACLDGRGYVIPDDIKQVAAPLLRHRLLLFPQAELEGRSGDAVIQELLQHVKPPR